LQAEALLGTVILYINEFKIKGYEEAGWAVSVWKDSAEVEAISGKLGRAEVFDAEVVALVALDVAVAEKRALILSDS